MRITLYTILYGNLLKSRRRNVKIALRLWFDERLYFGLCLSVILISNTTKAALLSAYS